MRTIDTPPTVPDTPDVIATVGERASDVINAMLFGEYGHRVRKFAQTEVGRAWTERRLDQAPVILTAILDEMHRHMHPVHLGTIAKKIAYQLLVPGHTPADPELDGENAR